MGPWRVRSRCQWWKCKGEVGMALWIQHRLLDAVNVIRGNTKEVSDSNTMRVVVGRDKQTRSICFGVVQSAAAWNIPSQVRREVRRSTDRSGTSPARQDAGPENALCWQSGVSQQVENVCSCINTLGPLTVIETTKLRLILSVCCSWITLVEGTG